jgi:mRNA interferase RelE/StbE
MSFRVEYHPLVVKRDIPKPDPTTKSRIRQAIERKLMSHPEVFGVPLRHSREGHRKLRVGDYRVVFILKGSCVRVLLIEHRSVVYSLLLQRASK